MYKIMVVDDELIIRRGIINALQDWEGGFVVVGEAENGKEALELLPDLLPEVMITDICMPTLNGLELIETAKTINPDIKIIILSGYDDFEYAQKALRLGVAEYILKPVHSEQLLTILERFQVELDQRFRFLEDLINLKRQLKVSQPLLREWFFHSLLAGKMTPEELEQKLQDLSLPLTGCLFGVALIRMKNLEQIRAANAGVLGFVQSLLVEVIETIFPQWIQAYPCFWGEDKLAVIFSLPTFDRQNVFMELNQNLKRVMLTVQKQLPIDIYAALGGLVDELIAVCHSYTQAEEAMQFSLLKDRGGVVNYEDIHLHADAPSARPLELERQLLLQVRLGEDDQISQSVRGLLDDCQQDPVRIKLYVFEITLLLVRTVAETNGNGMGWSRDLNGDPYKLVHQCESKSDLELFLSDFALGCSHEIQKTRQGKKYSIIEKVKEIIEGSFARSEFSLDDVAGRLFISPNYLRSLFKQQVGESFVEYLTRRRMEQARILLDDITLKVHQIAETVGYDDQHYFSICFKKYYGLTPSDYREAKTFGKA